MKILLIGEYSNVHNTLKAGLERLGHKVVVASNGDYWKAYPRDIDLARPSGRLAGLRLTLHLFANLHKLRGYDIVQIINPIFIDLKAKRIQYIYNYLRRHNKKIIMGAFGMDYYWVHVNSTTMPLRYSDFNIGKTLRTNRQRTTEQNNCQRLRRHCGRTIRIPSLLSTLLSRQNNIHSLSHHHRREKNASRKERRSTETVHRNKQEPFRI